MYFSYPYFLESTPELGFADAVQHLANVAALVKKVKSLGIKKLNSQDCKEVVPLYVAAQKELVMVDWRTRNSLNRFKRSSRASPRLAWSTEGCWVFLACVHEGFVEPYQAAKRYIYIPFNLGITQELREWATKWRAYYRNRDKRKDFETIEHSLTGRPLKDIPLLSQIYILGHSSAGSDMLSPQVNTTNRLDTVHYNMLAKRMRDAGLSTEFWGRIKVYACKGGADSATGQAFTAKFADVMRTRWNYVNCEYFGYTVELAAPTTFELLEGRLTSALEVSDQERLVEMARGSETIKAKLFSPGFKAQMAQYTSQEAKREFLKHWLIRWLQMEKEKKPSSVRQQF